MASVTPPSVLRQMRHGAKNALHTFGALLNLAELHPASQGGHLRQEHSRRLLAVAAVFDHLRVRTNENGVEDLVVDTTAYLSSLAKRCQAVFVCPEAGPSGLPQACLSLERSVALGLYASEQNQELQVVREQSMAMLAVLWRFAAENDLGHLHMGFPLESPLPWGARPQPDFSREIIRLTCSTLAANYQREQEQAASCLHFPLEIQEHALLREP